ncbi:MAG: hypothetical protein FWD26_06640 [Treponema sp.]|nr:hypothetical protein [Treponema sp.]
MEEHIDSFTDKLERIFKIILKYKWLIPIVIFLVSAAVIIFRSGIFTSSHQDGLYFNLSHTQLSGSFILNNETIAAEEGHAFVIVYINTVNEASKKRFIGTEDFELESENTENYKVNIGFFMYEEGVQIISPRVSYEKNGRGDLIMAFEIKYEGSIYHIDLTQYRVVAFPNSDTLRWEAPLTPARNF